MADSSDRQVSRLWNWLDQAKRLCTVDSSRILHRAEVLPLSSSHIE